MLKQEVTQQIVQIIENVTEIPKEQIKEDSAITDELELSSLEVFMLIGEIESALPVHFKANELQNIVTIGDLVDSILKDLNE